MRLRLPEPIQVNSAFFLDDGLCEAQTIECSASVAEQYE
jgi:hypothetical protein